METVIAKDADLSGTTTIRFRTLLAGVRMLPVHLVPVLRIAEASFAMDGPEPDWKPVAFIQEEAVYELTYRIPSGNEILSVGKKVEETTEGSQAVSTWKTEHPVQVAGFNYGKFKKLAKQDETSRLDVEVYTNPGTPNIVREINAAMSGGGLGFDGEVDPETGVNVGGMLGESLGNVNTARLAESALADGLNSARLFTVWFGPLQQKHVAITQQSDMAFGQSWPSLIFMPYISFLDGTQRQRLGLSRAKDFVDQVGYHEFAHQWWGHLVGADTYRDQWLEEGFSEFSSAVAVQHVAGWPAYDKFWKERRKEILEKGPGNAMAPYEAGPITQGWRLFTARTPSAGGLIYPKGGYVLHMIRMLMHEPGAPNPDAKFIEMMKDYTKSYGGRMASTADFQKVVERHMVPNLNATGNGKLDWFFAQWVHGTEVPRYTHDLKVDKAGEETRIHGTLRQEGVSKDFRALVPIYLEFDKGTFVRVGLLPMAGDASVPVDVKFKLPKKPKRALVNAHGDILARD